MTAKLDDIIEQQELIEKRKVKLQQIADHIARNLIILCSAKHDDTIKEHDQLDRIERQIYATTQIQVRDVRYFLQHLRGFITAAQEENIKKDTELIIDNLLKEETLLRDIEYVLNDTTHRKIDQLMPLIEKLLRKIEETRKEMKEETILLQTK